MTPLTPDPPHYARERRIPNDPTPIPPHLTALSLLQLFAQACLGHNDLPVEATRGLTWPQAWTLPDLDAEQIIRLVNSFVMSVRALGSLAGLSDEETERVAELVARESSSSSPSGLVVSVGC